jgi:hypothetical protein
LVMSIAKLSHFYTQSNFRIAFRHNKSV